MMNKKTLGKVIVGLVIIFMSVMIISLLHTNYELNTKLSENEQTFEELSDKYDEVCNVYEKLVEEIHNKYEGNKYTIRYMYNDKLYTHTGNGKLFGETGLINEYLNK